MTYTDLDLVDFLRALDKSESVTVTDWEAQFIESNLECRSFSEPKRKVILGLIETYAERIGWS